MTWSQRAGRQPRHSAENLPCRLWAEAPDEPSWACAFICKSKGGTRFLCKTNPGPTLCFSLQFSLPAALPYPRTLSSKFSSPARWLPLPFLPLAMGTPAGVENKAGRPWMCLHVSKEAPR